MKLIYLKRKKWKRTSSAAGQTDYETLISLAWGKQKLFFKYLFYRALTSYFLKDALIEAIRTSQNVSDLV